MGRIVIETDPDTGLDDVELTLDNGTVLKFCGRGQSELKHVGARRDAVDVSTTGGFRKFVPGELTPEHWEFTLSIESIAAVRTVVPG